MVESSFVGLSFEVLKGEQRERGLAEHQLCASDLAAQQVDAVDQVLVFYLVDRYELAILGRPCQIACLLRGLMLRSWGVPFWMNTTSAPVSALRVEFVASFVQQATDDAGGEAETAV